MAGGKLGSSAELARTGWERTNEEMCRFLPLSLEESV